MRRSIWSIIALPALIVSALPGPSQAQPADPAAEPAPAAVAHVVELPADPQTVVDYWTPERMEAAQPVEHPDAQRGNGDKGKGKGKDNKDKGKPDKDNKGKGNKGKGKPDKPNGKKDQPFTEVLTQRQSETDPHRSIGKLFFTLFGFNFVCSGTAVTSAGRWGEGSRQLVVTAGHCCNDGDGQFATYMAFVPGYYEGAAPHGTWLATVMTTTPEWNTGLGLAYARDVCFVNVTGTGEYEGAALHDVVKPLPIAFDRKHKEDKLHRAVPNPLGKSYAMIGYGVQTWGGEVPVLAMARVEVLDQNFFPHPMGAASENTGGASGGPWLYRYKPGKHGKNHNIINSVNSYVYGGVSVMYGPRFDDQIHSLWSYTANQAA